MGSRLLLILSLAAAAGASAWRDQCDKMINAVLQRGNSSHYRYDDGDKSSAGRMRVHLWACEEICGSSPRAYPLQNIVERMSLWIVPLLLLIGNFQFAPLGPGNFFCVVCHLIGDPIDSICSLLTKLEVRRRLFARWAAVDEPPRPPARFDEEARLAYAPGFALTRSQAQDLAAVNAVYDDWMHSSDKVFAAMRAALLQLSAPERAQFLSAIAEAAHKLAESRADDQLRAWLAIAGYVAAIVAAFMRTLDGGPEKMTAHSIAFAMSMVWLVPAVMVSTTAGGFTSKRAAMRIVRELQDELGPVWPVQRIEAWTCTSTVWRPFAAGGTRKALLRSTEPLGDALAWCGGNYSYRPFKRVTSAGLSRPEKRRGGPTFAAERPAALLYSYAVVSVLLAVGCAMALSCLTPTMGLGCRCVLLLPPSLPRRSRR